MEDKAHTTLHEVTSVQMLQPGRESDDGSPGGQLPVEGELFLVPVPPDPQTSAQTASSSAPRASDMVERAAWGWKIGGLVLHLWVVFWVAEQAGILVAAVVFIIPPLTLVLPFLMAAGGEWGPLLLEAVLLGLLFYASRAGHPIWDD